MFFGCKKEGGGDKNLEKLISGMIWISEGKFAQGAVIGDSYALSHEKPSHEVYVDGFYIDITEVTNAQFSRFIEETGYVTVAERPIDWEIMKKELPKGIPKPHDSLLRAGSLVFKKAETSVSNLNDFSKWWKWTAGANWRNPKGPQSSIKGKENYPVVHIALEDALAYCKWAGKRLPTEAEWEYAARGNQKNAIFFWGKNEKKLPQNANTWGGEFPVSNDTLDGYEGLAPVKQYPPNPFGLYDMAGNVWEWTLDDYDTEYYKKLSLSVDLITNPKAVMEQLPNQKEQQKVIKGGSFLCSATYCASYRISARMSSGVNSSTEHLGFRTVTTKGMISNYIN